MNPPIQIKSEDPRARRTQRLLRDALVALLDDKPYEKIRVGDIVSHAEVARPTFYAHYESKEDLLFDVVHKLLPKVYKCLEKSLRSDTIVLHQLVASLMGELFQHQQTWSILIDADIDDLLVGILRQIATDITDRLQQAQKLPLDPLVHFTAHGVVSFILAIFRFWLKEKPNLSPDELTKLMVEMHLLFERTFYERAEWEKPPELRDKTPEQNENGKTSPP